jgi:fatty-acid peroxygenase
VELLNVLRPTVAVAWLGTFAVRTLHEHPDWRSRVLADERACEAFAQEVRRLAPFVPALAAKVRGDLEWQGARLPRGGRLVLDVPGTNRDPRSWPSPLTFDPQRFIDRRPGAFEFVPQGGGHAEDGHRCPGKGMAVRLLQRTLTAVAALDYEPIPGCTPDLHRIPAPRDVLRIAVRAGSSTQKPVPMSRTESEDDVGAARGIRRHV